MVLTSYLRTSDKIAHSTACAIASAILILSPFRHFIRMAKARFKQIAFPFFCFVAVSTMMARMFKPSAQLEMNEPSNPSRQWDAWLSEEMSSGRWAMPHTGVFCPPPETFGIKFIPLPPVGKVITTGENLVFVSDDFAWIHQQYGERIRLAFQEGNYGAKVTHRFPNGSPCRSDLSDTSFLTELEEDLAQRFNAIRFKLGASISVYRLSNPDGLPEPSSNWISEQWHTDNFDDSGFKLIIYMSDVDKENAPFEYQDPPTFVPVIPNNTSGIPEHLKRMGLYEEGLSRYLQIRFASRLNYVGKSVRVTGPAGTSILFKNSNLPHKGNYCRRGIRDVISFQFHSL